MPATPPFSWPLHSHFREPSLRFQMNAWLSRPDEASKASEAEKLISKISPSCACEIPWILLPFSASKIVMVPSNDAVPILFGDTASTAGIPTDSRVDHTRPTGLRLHRSITSLPSWH